MWKWRGLSLLGRIQIVKTFAVPKLIYRASVLPISKEQIKETNSIIYGFIWNGKDKIKRNALISDVNKGGLKALSKMGKINQRAAVNGKLKVTLNMPRFFLSLYFLYFVCIRFFFFLI